MVSRLTAPTASTFMNADVTIASKARATTNLTLCERQGVSLIAAPSTANTRISYRKSLYAGKFFPSCDSQVKVKLCLSMP